MALARADNRDSFSISMRRFRNEELGMRNCEILFWLTIATLMVPNVILDITEGMSQWACVANILLPLGIYTLLMSISRKPGKMTWWLFPYIFFAAFQVVLLYLYG